LTRELVTSTDLKSVGYDAVAHVLEVELPDGPIFRYFEVPVSVYEALMSTPSKGQYFNDNVVTKYECTRIA
jgi:hypothetical protein